MKLEEYREDPDGCIGLPTREEARCELEQLLADPEFHCTERNKHFLRFVTEETLADRADAIKAYTIAVDVFGRPPSFDPGTDPIVRIEATRLRSALARYYEVHVRPAGVRIELPKGRYIPMFSRVEAAHGDPLPLDAPPPQALPPARPRLSRLYPNSREIWTAVAGGVAVGLCLGLALLAIAYRFAAADTAAAKPEIWVEVQLDGLDKEGEASRLHDSLIVALSDMKTMRLMLAKAGADGGAGPEQLAGDTYRVMLKYCGACGSLVWRLDDRATGEILGSGEEKLDLTPETVERIAMRVRDSIPKRN